MEKDSRGRVQGEWCSRCFPSSRDCESIPNLSGFQLPSAAFFENSGVAAYGIVYIQANPLKSIIFYAYPMLFNVFPDLRTQ